MMNKGNNTTSILLTGSVPYWNTVAGDLLSRTGYSCEILGPGQWLTFLKWFLTGKLRRFDLVYQVCAVNNWPVAFFLSLMNKPYMLHWIGSDVLSFREKKAAKGWRKWIVSRLAYRQARQHLADSAYLLDELKSLRIDASVVKLLPCRIETDVMPLPETCSVLAYWHDEREEFYRGKRIYALAEMFPQVVFRIAKANKTTSFVPSNVAFLGQCEDMESVYRDTSVFIRTPEHDSLSAMVLEALSRGRYVIYNKSDVPGCHYADSVEECANALREIMQKTEPNYEGARFVRENFNPAREARKLEGILDTLFNKQTLA